MKFQLVVKSGVVQLASIEGKTISADDISLADVERVIEIEHWLERMFGLRFHVNVMGEDNSAENRVPS